MATTVHAWLWSADWTDTI